MGEIRDPYRIEDFWWVDREGKLSGTPGTVYSVVDAGDDQVTLAPFGDQYGIEHWMVFFIDAEEAMNYADSVWQSVRARIQQDFGFDPVEPEDCPPNILDAVLLTLGRDRREFDLDYVYWQPSSMRLRNVKKGSVPTEPEKEGPPVIEAPETVDVSFIRAMLVGGIDNERMIRLVERAAEHGVWLSPIYTEGKPLPAVLPEGVQIVLILKGAHVTLDQADTAKKLAKANGVPVAGIVIGKFIPSLVRLIEKISITPVVRKALKSEATKGAYPRMKSAIGEEPEIYGLDDTSGLFGAPIYGTGEIEMAGEQPDGWSDDSAAPGPASEYRAAEDGLAAITVAVPLAAILFGR
jgi:hypothetical protein